VHHTGADQDSNNTFIYHSHLVVTIFSDFPFWPYARFFAVQGGAHGQLVNVPMGRAQRGPTSGQSPWSWGRGKLPWCWKPLACWRPTEAANLHNSLYLQTYKIKAKDNEKVICVHH